MLVALGGFLIAALLHGIWNLSAATGHLIGAYVLFQVPLFVCFWPSSSGSATARGA